MRTPTINPVASGPDFNQDGSLWYRDETGDQAIWNLLRDEDFRLVDKHGGTVFHIKANLLVEIVLPRLTFTRTRRGRDVLRAHRREVA